MRAFAAGLTLLVLLPVGAVAVSARQAARPATGPDAVMPDAVIDEYCASCHSRSGKAGGVVLEGFALESPLVSSERLERMIRKVRAGQMPPAGAERPAPDVLVGLAEALERRADAKAAAAPPAEPRALARLNRAEYALVVEDLTGLGLDVRALLPPDTASGGFDHIADAQVSSAALVGGFLRSASKIAAETVRTRPARVFVCRPSAADETACVDRIVRRFVERALRGQADAADQADALTQFEAGRRSGGLDEGLRQALQSVLVSPKFLFRPEPTGPDGFVTDVALASRLSFFLWSRGPDAALLAEARAGRLHTVPQLVASARRMLAAPEARTLATRFGAQWLRLQDLEKTTIDPALRRDMRGETERFLLDLIARDGRVLDLVTADYSFINGRLALLYGIRGVTGEAFRRVPMPAERRGVLGQASVLALTSLGTRTSPVLRGKWVLDVLLGTPPPPPPPNVPALDDSVPLAGTGVSKSTRQRVEAHRSNPQCASCHRLIDPPGLTLEGFDQTGRWRATDNGVPIDASASLYDGQAMDGPAGLRAAVLSHADVVLRHFTEQLMTYALGRRLTYRDAPAVRAIAREARRADNRLSAFVAGIISSDAFRRGVVPATENR